MLSNLKAKGIEVESPDVILGELAEAYGMTPARLYDMALGQVATGVGGGGRHGQTGSEAGHGGGPGRGFGRMTLRQYCEQMDLDLNTAVKKLKDAGFTVSADLTIRDIADSTGVHPSEIRNILQAPAP